MTNWTTEDKETTTWTDEDKTVMTDTFENLEKVGTIIGGYDYEEEDMDYDQVLDLDTGNTVFYEGLGISTDWTNINKTT